MAEGLVLAMATVSVGAIAAALHVLRETRRREWLRRRIGA